MLVFWISFALGNLAKGPMPLPLVLIPLFFYVSIFRQWRKLFNWTSAAGLIILLIIVLPWPLEIAHKLNWDLVVWRKEFVDRFFGGFENTEKPFYYYLMQMFIFILPWAAFLPMALAAPFFRVWSNKRQVMLFLWMAFVAGLAFLSLSAGKRQHYILPVMPAMTILIGILVEDMAFVQKAYTQKYAKDVLRSHIVVVAAGVIAGLVYVMKTNRQLLVGTIIIGAAAIAAAAITAVLFAKRKPAFACGAIFSGIVILVMLAYVFFVNPLNYNEPSRQFTQAVAEKVPDSEKLVAYKSASTRFVHYFGRRVPEITTETETYSLYNEGYWVVAFGVYLDELLRDGRYEIVYMQEDAERHNGKAVDGALFHKSAITAKGNT
jgi:4-amino-4-deoxy-L-arabinose transferase-like glycosyltransferase